jgi:hypothetical protein
VALLRSWMLRVEQYAQLYEALLARGVRLLNDPRAYRTCHELPSTYPYIAEHRPATVWLPQERLGDVEAIMAVLAPFGDAPVVLKDYVKSLAHAWNEACFIPMASDRAAVERVVRRFVELRGEELQGGLVFRAYEPFVTMRGAASERPRVREYRRYLLDRQVLAAVPYWDGATQHEPLPPAGLFADVLARIPSRFFTVDVAQREYGTWRIVELGDGQVAGLLPHLDHDRFYHSLYTLLLQTGRDSG